MAPSIHDIIEYIVAFVNEFSKKFGLSDKEAYNYIRAYEGVGFIKKNYGIIHTLDFNEAVKSVALFCRKKGGHL